MKRIFVALLILSFVATGPAYGIDALGSAFGTLTTADVLGQGKGNFGFGVGIADATSFVGSFTFGLSEYTDGRVKLGLVDNDGADTKFTIGADFKWQYWTFGSETSHPFDMAVGGFFEYADFDAASVVQLGGQLIGSYPIELKSGGTLAPYARVNARLESISFDQAPGSGADDSESNLELGLNGGVQWIMTSTVTVYGEFQIDGNDGVFFGVDFNVM
ncbi:MAG: hypothetical protein GY867_08790 [bacterium]|nr:hypothetical protein [bacterium]